MIDDFESLFLEEEEAEQQQSEPTPAPVLPRETRRRAGVQLSIRLPLEELQLAEWILRTTGLRISQSHLLRHAIALGLHQMLRHLGAPPAIMQRAEELLRATSSQVE